MDMGITDFFSRDEGNSTLPGTSPIPATRLKVEEKDGLVLLTLQNGPLESYSFLLPPELSTNLQVALTNITGLPSTDEEGG